MRQLQIQAALDAVEFNWRKSLSRYMMQNRETYIGFAHLIKPTDFNAEEIYRRLHSILMPGMHKDLP